MRLVAVFTTLHLVRRRRQKRKRRGDHTRARDGHAKRHVFSSGQREKIRVPRAGTEMKTHSERIEYIMLDDAARTDVPHHAAFERTHDQVAQLSANQASVIKKT